MIDLEDALFDLAEHLDHPAGADLEVAVLERINASEAADGARRPRVRALLAIAASVVVIAAALVAIAPARRAIADWLGIGAVEIRRVDHPLPNGPSGATVPGAPGPTAPGTDAAAQLAAARRAVQFTIALPHDASTGALAGVEVDPRVIGGLTVLRYPHFTLVEIASTDDAPVVGKIVEPGAEVVSDPVNGAAGFWVTSAHQVAYLDRSGRLRVDTVRRSGPVLVWQRGGVTYRIEGVNRATAERIAASVR